MSNPLGRATTITLAVVAITTLLLSGCGSSDSPTSSPTSAPAEVTAPPVEQNDLAQFYSQQPQWQSYAAEFEVPGLSDRIQTTQIEVPIDYDNPQAGTTEIVLYRQVAAERSDGAIVLNPGGPGGAGDGLVLDADFIFEPEVLDTRDIVSFDPRGVYRSDPITCRTDEEVDAYSQAVPNSETAIRTAQDLGDACLRENPDLLAHIDTSNVARDLDVMRAVLGQPLLDYLGFSYGTEIGQRYLQLFPQRSGRIVLDAPVPINMPFEQLLQGQAEGFEASYSLFVDDYIDACTVGDNGCELGNVDPEVRRSIQDLVDAADRNPLPASDGRTMSGTALSTVLAYSLYGADGWGEVSDVLVAAQSGNGEPALELYDLYLERNPDGTYADNAADAYVAISAMDNPTTVTTEQVEAFAVQLAEISPLFGTSLAWELWQISNWPVSPDAQAVATPDAFVNIPAVLIIGGANDPATPLVWAEATRDLLPGSTLVVWDGVGHTATGTGSNCVDDIVSAFLLEGVLPMNDTECPA